MVYNPLLICIVPLAGAGLKPTVKFATVSCDNKKGRKNLFFPAQCTMKDEQRMRSFLVTTLSNNSRQFIEFKEGSFQGKILF